MSSDNKAMGNKKKSFFAVLSVLLFLLISFNGASIFSIRIPFPENVAGDSRNLVSVSSSLSNLMYAVGEDNPSVISNVHLQNLQIHENITAGDGDSIRFISVPESMKEAGPTVISYTPLPPLRKSHSLPLESKDLQVKNKNFLKELTLIEESNRLRRGDFRAKVKEFFSKNESSCKVRFFMTWISSLNSFSEKEFHSIETLFNTHPKGCLLIVSNSMDSNQGRQILKPFLEKGFRLTAISPDLKYLFKNTMAEYWFMKLTNGDLDVGYVPLGQNLSNLIRLCLLYKFGGVYLDTDVLVLKNFSKLKNSIGAQTIDLDSKKWSRLNNAVMVFDKMHPLVYKFIEEFSLTFDGNKWGHNGPYLVSRVVSRLQDRPGYNFTILPPIAFYPVNWNRVRNLFRGAKNEADAKWLRGKFKQIGSQSYAVHLWNKQSRKLHVEKGSIVGKILSNRCVFCNASINNVVGIEE
ncbi:hypothetical protein E3N88_37171 [Mikania micrantha]|uniref:Alpha 1,4-glycosyltransferase domain-containing protein n=2 Tax=Mikania micrantha TaxID=192012 RepID=A0A5N6M6D9_9ASTR|nr:hypothetical protein E3N88_44997 [Mikania micrantha]KAD3069291.1 hypothetical protein E3N88_37171 [Mikania micrantha]